MSNETDALIKGLYDQLQRTILLAAEANERLENALNGADKRLIERVVEQVLERLGFNRYDMRGLKMPDGPSSTT